MLECCMALVPADILDLQTDSSLYSSKSSEWWWWYVPPLNPPVRPLYVPVSSKNLRRTLCTKGGTQKLRLVKLGSGEEAMGADEGEVKVEGGAMEEFSRNKSVWFGGTRGEGGR
ncbi:hypothetical protein NQZ68_033855 [Dissostichus eleginoides]|nr:hypothetical protein NQZ68_033855 [Dissostichus eleginoides]